ncbi:hypothetical protein BpHYR1_024638 [Brachionus plicatilis]|uniref:Uncharacterized protein n=1 Tax=Brachionus plicatilis TaxID=10195 RepID=A0A3M7SGJ5_BRAPC|nr:hypothetical protein BpHYR1_024638 [Brachionus plicatilis]
MDLCGISFHKIKLKIPKRILCVFSFIIIKLGFDLNSINLIKNLISRKNILSLGAMRTIRFVFLKINSHSSIKLMKKLSQMKSSCSNLK